MIYIFAAIGICLLFFALLLFNRWYMNILVERRIASYQNDLAARHCEEVENIYKQMRGWRHDYHNHIQVMKAYVAGKQIDVLDDYLSMLNKDLTSVDTIIKTGNVMVDAILNSKITIAESRKISVNAKAVVPKALSVQDVDLCVVLGNLLDNAIEACEKIIDEHKRFIRVYIGIHKELLYISVTNSTGGEIRKSGSNYLSTKALSSHGFGLVRIDKISEKYNGFVDRQSEEGVFATEVMLPL